MWLKTLMDTLRKIALEPNAPDVGPRKAGPHVQKYVDEYPQVGIDRLIEAIRAEAKAQPSQARFWKAVEDYAVIPHRLRP